MRVKIISFEFLHFLGKVYQVNEIENQLFVLFLWKIYQSLTNQRLYLFAELTDTFHLLGISYGLIEKYKIGLDINLANWTSNGSNNTLVQNTQEFILGGEITPDSRNITNYLKRVTYRFGFNYGKLPYLVQNNSINEFGINFGASFPVAGLSTLDLAIKFGERGTIENGLINETFMQIVLGLTINEKWFIKRKYN